MIQKRKNPAPLACGNRVKSIEIARKLFDAMDPNEQSISNQLDLIAAISVMRRCHVDFWHALTVCRLAGLGGAA